MKLYLVTNKAINEYQWDYYDSFVVCCNNEDEAERTHPSGRVLDCVDRLLFDDWPTELKKVDVKYLGEADIDTSFGVVCASFNAG